MKKFLVIRFRRVGDAVLSTSLCSSIKKSFPEAEVHYVLNEGIISLFEHHPAIDTLIAFSSKDMRPLSYIKKVKRIMKEGGYDVIIDTRSTPKTLLFALFSLKSKYRIGWKKYYSLFLHNHKVCNSKEGVSASDEVDLTLCLMNPLEKERPIQKDHDFKLYLTAQEKSQYRGYMASKGIDFTKLIVTCASTARVSHKSLPKEQMLVLLQKFADKYKDVQLILNFGGEVEKEAVVELHRRMGNHPRIFSDIEANNLRELLALLANSVFFFGNEGGPRHMSQAINIPSFAIYSPSISIRYWLPRRCDRFQGVELREINPEVAVNPKLLNSEKFALMDTNVIWSMLDAMLEKYLK